MLQPPQVSVEFWGLTTGLGRFLNVKLKTAVVEKSKTCPPKKFPQQIIKVNENQSSYYLAGTGASTGYMTPYGTYATLPQQGAFNGLTPYQNAANAASMQEARLQ